MNQFTKYMLRLKRRPSMLKLGMSGARVERLQWGVSCFLDEKDRIKQDGVFGFKTKAAVVSFQKHFKLEVDGIVGAETWSWLVIPSRLRNQEALRTALYFAYRGAREIGGNNKGSWVKTFMGNEGQPWCVGFATYCHSLFKEHGRRWKSTGDLYMSYEATWEHDNPSPGAFLFVVDKKSRTGFRHTALVSMVEGAYIWVVEGNVRARKWAPWQRDCVRIGKYHVSKVKILYPPEDS